MAESRPHGAHLGWWLFAISACVYLLAGPTYLSYDGSVMYLVSESLVQHHSLQIADPFRHVNQPYAYFGIGVSLLLVPLVAAGHLLAHDGRALVLLYQPTVTALTVVAIYRLLLELGCSWRRSLGVGLLFAFATPAWHNAGELFSEPLIGATTTSGFLWLLIFRRRGERRWLIAAGMAVALAMLTRWDSLLLVALPLSVYALFLVLRPRTTLTHRAADLAGYGAPITAGLAWNLAYDALRFGHPFGALPGSPGAGFTAPLSEGLYGLLLSPGHGLLIYAPLVVLGLAGSAGLARAWRAEALLLLATFAIRLLFFAHWWSWYGGAVWGPRYLLPVVPLLLIPIGFVPRHRWLLAAAGLIVVVSLGIQVLDQLVPYGLFYEPLADQLTISHPDADVDKMLALDWRHAQPVEQLQLLVRGRMQPAWGAVAFLMPLMVAMLAAALTYVWRRAARLDRVARSGPELRALAL